MDTAKCSLCQQADAILSCDCTARVVLLCTKCVGLHAMRPGRHAITAYSGAVSDVTEGNLLCDLCRRNAAETICSCSTPLKKYCESCWSSHISKARFSTHSFIPISAWESVTTRDYVSLIRDLSTTNLAKSILNQNLINIEECRETIKQRFSAAVSELKSIEQGLCEQLDSVQFAAQAYIDLLCAEMDSVMYGKTNVSKCGLVNRIREMPENEVKEELKLFSFKAVETGSVDVAKNWVQFEFNEKKDPLATVFPLINGNTLLQFSLINSTFSKVSLNTPPIADFATSFFLHSGQTLYCIGGDKSNRACTVNLSTYITTPLPHMSSNRGFSGLAIIGTDLYTFGGHFVNFLSTVERLCINEGEQWKSVADMNSARCGFNPVVTQRSMVYLIGGQGAKGAIDVFDPKTVTFTTLTNRLPENWFTTSVICSGSILVVHSNSLFVLDESGALTEKSTGGHQKFRWSNTCPVYYKERVYYVCNEGSGPSELHSLPLSIPTDAQTSPKVTEIRF